ncbi:MAG: hypothetical protein AYL33_003170 [Candidatus Bathyarchaeota archaeon B63]|nr:MAG: hypothetical protein AYL33_003170 [Candidatus Bathyarchaeota archaeon B63]
MPILRAETLRKISEEIFKAYGAPAEEARLVSESLVEANLCGHDSHGVIRIIQYVKAIERGALKPGAEIEIVRETPSSALIRGNWGFGQVVARRAMELAIGKAEENSVSVVCAYDLYHIGRLADYTALAAERGMVGVAMVNSTPTVAPYGGRERLLSTAPISYAFPTGEESMFLLDIATSVCAEGKVRVSLHRGERLPDGLIIDKDGHPSTDPADLYEGGALLPLGGDLVGYKGFGLGLAVEVLAGILSGAGCAYEEGKVGNGVFFEVINIDDFMPVEEFKERIDALIRRIKSSKLRPGFTEILIPGELELRTRRVRRDEGIYIPERTWREITEIAEKRDVRLADILSRGC